MKPAPAMRRTGSRPERDPPHENALPLLWRDARALLWVMVAGEFLAAILTLALDTPGALNRFAVISLATQFVVLLTVLALYLLRKRLRLFSPQRAAYIAFAAMLATTLVVALLTRFVFEPAVRLSPSDWNSLIWRSVAIVAIAGVMGLALLQNHWRIKQLALQAKQSQLEALQARIQPHFLFNTLNTAVALARSQPGRTEQLLLDLADVFRAALATPALVPLTDELSLVRRYLDIETIRLGERLRIDWLQDGGVDDVLVPGLSIQPLVENAVRHGIEPVVDGGSIDISVRRMADAVVIRIGNDVPLNARALPGHHIGLRASRERIAALGDGAQLSTTQTDGRHVATIRIPLR